MGKSSLLGNKVETRVFSEGRDEDESHGPICPGCGVFMQDKDPNLPGYYQQRKLIVEISYENDVLDDAEHQGFDEGEFEDDDKDDEGFLDESDNEVEEIKGGLTDQFDWDSDEWEAKLLEDKDDKLNLDGFTPAGVGYGNITEETVNRTKKEKVFKAEEKKMVREAEKVIDEVTVCAWCHSLRNYGQVKNQTAENLIPDFDFDRLISTQLMKPSDSGSASVVVMVVDCVDFDRSFSRTAAKSLFKSTLIKAFVKKEGPKVTKLTKAPVPGTTLGILRIGGILSAKGKMFDTSGLLHPYLMSMRLNRDEQKMVEVRKELRPRTYRMKACLLLLLLFSIHIVNYYKHAFLLVLHGLCVYFAQNQQLRANRNKCISY